MCLIQKLRDVTVEEWDDVYTHAVAAGSGALPTDEERVAAPDELLAEVLPRLIRLSALIGASILPHEPASLRADLCEEAAGTVRLLDRALTTHGRDNGYDPSSWHEQATTDAYAVAGNLPHASAALLLLELVETAAAALASTVLALRRDRIGVPESLITAIGPLLIVYAASC